MSPFLLSLLPAWAVAEAEAPVDPNVRVVKDVNYYGGKGPDPVKHKLDLYLPKDKKDFPVVFFVHGGAWQMGDKSEYAKFGELFAKNGVGCVVTNYRLSPKVSHPEHIKDVAAAFAWVHGHIAEYGGRPDRIFAAGHSAGGHLVALLGTDPDYLKTHGLSLKDLRGVIAVSGVYVTLPPLVYGNVFPKDPEARAAAFPIRHVRAGCPPFLLLFADADLPLLGTMAQKFRNALKAAGVPTKMLELAGRDHISILLGMFRPADEAAREVFEFVRSHSQ